MNKFFMTLLKRNYIKILCYTLLAIILVYCCLLIIRNYSISKSKTYIDDPITEDKIPLAFACDDSIFMSKAYKLHPSYFINRSHKNGVSFLQYAIQNNKIHIAHEFIIDGFPIDNIDSLRHTAMSDAIMANEPEIIMDLLKHGVSANKICIWVDNATPQSPLQFACTIGASDIVRILIENGASINGGDSVKHTIPIQIVLDHLIKGSILQKFDPRFSTNKNKFLQTFYLLLKYGSNINVTDGDHESMLFEAIRYDNRNMVNILINNGVNVDVKNNRDENPIEIAKSWHHNDLIKLLTQHK